MLNVKMQPTEIQNLSPKIAVIGVGGAGGNAVNNMIASNLEGCEFLVCNTDSQALQHSLADHKVQLGVNVTGGLGAGSKPEVGQAAAEESLEEVLRYLDGANMAFVTAGMGGGTGTGAAPVIAKACREQGILTVGVVTKPFHFEGVHRMQQAEKGIEAMQEYVDTLIVIPNQNLFRVANEKTTFAEAFKMADTVLQSGVRGVTDLMVRPGLVNLDFADIRTAMIQMGKAMMGTGEATGDKRAVDAAEAAINNPLLDDVSMKGANGVIINVTGGYDMTLFEADEACNRIRDEVDPNANIIFGATFDENMDGYMRVSIVATGIESEASQGKIFTGNNGGGNRTAPEKIERATPSTVSSAAQANTDTTAARATMATSAITGRDVLKGLTAPSPISSQAKETNQMVEAAPIVRSDVMAEAEKMAQRNDMPSDDRASMDMFEQSEFMTQGANVTVDVKPASQSFQPVEPLRGQTVDNAFIPPKPMETDINVPENGIGSHISGFNAQHVPEEKRMESGSGLQLKPPAKPAVLGHAPKQSRSPSLFERITGSVQTHIDSFRDDNEMIKTADNKSIEAPSQGRLNIDAPSKPAVKIDDELDIPAFLRRQAN